MYRDNIIIGDIHGTRDEFNKLLDKIKYDPKKHRVILCGDEIDRGPDSPGLIKQIREMGIESVYSNHIDKCLRWRKYEVIKEITGVDNPINNISDKRIAEWRSFSKNDLQWMSELPYKLHIKDNWYVVHGGMEPSKDFSAQDVNQIIRIRFVDENGQASKERPTKDKPIKGIYFWAEKWNQPYNLVFGHSRFDEPAIFKNKNNTCIGIDCGSVYGGHLVAFNLDKNEFIKVKAKKVYYKK